MNRVIKFREWNEAFGRYITWDMLTSKGDIDTPLRALSSGTFEQYTGVDGANGTPIYEGDLVCRVYDGEPEYSEVDQVVWNDAKCAFELPNYTGFLTVLELKVIGNIHENPELLESL